MTTVSPEVAAALATLQSRWGAAAPRRAADRTGDPSEVGEVVGALATVPLPDELPEIGDPGARERDALRDGVVSTGFSVLDGILGVGGLPRSTSVGLRGEGSCGKTTIALRTVAQAQATGSIVAWLDLSRSFDPIEAVARGVSLEWLVIVTPEDLDEGLSIAGALLSGRAVDLLVVDLPPDRTAPRQPGGSRIGDRLHRLAALARRANSLLILLEPSILPSELRTAVAESAGLRLELERHAWVHLGRDVVGQMTEAVVARNRFGPPGRRARLEILYADGDERDACLVRDDLLRTEAVARAPAELAAIAPSIPVPGTTDDATSPPVLASSIARSGPRSLRLVAGGTGHRRRSTVDGRDRARRGPDRPITRRSSGDPARERASTRS